MCTVLTCNLRGGFIKEDSCVGSKKAFESFLENVSSLALHTS